MAVYKTPKNLTLGYSPSVKPTVPVVIDWSNPLSNGLDCCVLLGDCNKELVTQQTLTVGAGDIETIVYDGEQGRHFDGATQEYLTLPKTISYGAGSQWTLSFKAVRTGDVTNGDGVLLGVAGTSTNYVWLRYNTNVGVNANGQLITVSYTGGQDSTHRYTCVFTGDGKFTLYVDGQLVGISGLTGVPEQLVISHIGASYNSTTYAFDGNIFDVHIHNRALSDSEIKSLHENPYQLLKPQIETFYYTAGSGGGAITGSGSPTASTATSTGAGSVAGIISGSGAPQAQTATASATGLRVITGTGAPQSSAATSTGAGSIGGTVSGTGTPQADNATASGVGLRVITGSGTPNATTATSNGAGLRLISGTGTSQAENATASGTGATGNSIIGTGTPQAGLATASGAGLRVITGAGNVQATTATTSSTGKRIIAGTGAASAELATSTGIALRVITGSGNAQAEIATAIGYDVATTINPGRIYTVETENRIYTVETENRIYTKETEDRTYAA